MPLDTHVRREGYSSSLAAAQLREIGFPNATDVIGGVATHGSKLGFTSQKPPASQSNRLGVNSRRNGAYAAFSPGAQARARARSRAAMARLPNGGWLLRVVPGPPRHDRHSQNERTVDVHAGGDLGIGLEVA